MAVYLFEAVEVIVWFIVLWSEMNRIEEVYLMDWQDANGTMYVAKKDQNEEINKQAFQVEKQGGLRTL